MRPVFDLWVFLGLALGLTAALGVAHSFSQPSELVALAAGYVLFAVNYLLLAKIYATIIRVTQAEERQSHSRWFLMLGTGMKFVGLIGALYLLLVHYALSGFYLAFGSLLSLVVLTGVLVSSYLRTLGGSQRS